MNRTNLILYFILCLIFGYSNSLKCGEVEIENCIQCGTGDASNTCVQCKDKHFLLFHNLYCIPCDDQTYGQIGCGGNCDSSRYIETRNIFCNENDCKEGYYYLNGICLNCTEGLPGCKKCIIQVENNEKKYICKECLSNEYILDNEYNTCNHCSISYCSKCHYIDNNSIQCDKCDEGYYLNYLNECRKCRTVYIDNGICEICSDNDQDYESGICSCYNYYTLIDNSTCISCPDNCPYCEYNKQTNKIECKRCDSGFSVNKQKTCTACGEGCENCFLKEDLTPICLTCFSDTFLLEGKCLICQNNCKTCNIDNNGKNKCIECYPEYLLIQNGTCINCPFYCSSCYAKENGNIACSQCYDNYGIDSEDKCTLCSEGCQRCGFNKEANQFQCYECRKMEDPYSGELEDIYAYINNTFQCLSNTLDNNNNMYGCLIGSYNNVSNKYECYICKKNFILVKNEKICISPNDNNLNNCLEVEKISNEQGIIKYSCSKCSSNSVTITDFDKTNLCYDRNDNLSYCLEGERDVNNNLKCNECVPNSQMNNSHICECNINSFGKYNLNCYKCDDKEYGNPGCEASSGCNYYHSNDQLNCNKCKDGYFSYTEGQCYSCSNEIKNCKSCHFEYSNQKLRCDYCQDGYSYNYEENICELKNCEEYPEIMPGCIICEENLEEYKSKKICNTCKIGYFKTKENKCVYCKSEEYGGPSCLKCQYEKDENQNDKQNIICEYCPNMGNALTSDGKCYNCKLFLSDNCDYCTFNNSIGKLECNLCKPGYYLNSEGECISYHNYLGKIQNCYEYTFKINNISFCYYYYDDYNIYYCYNHYNNIFDFIMSDYFLNNNFDPFIPQINSSINTECKICLDGYYKNSDGDCVIISIEECTIFSIINYPERKDECRNLCYMDNYIYLDITLDFFNKYYYGTNSLIFNILNEDLNLNNKLCINRPSNSENLKNCKSVEYIEESNIYKCKSCEYDYILDNKTNTCINNNRYLEDNYNCIIENIGTNTNPIYSCSKCYKNSYLLISSENNIKFCIYPEEEIQYCKEVNANTTYINSIYNCTSCSVNHIPYDSKFFERRICQNIFDEIKKEKEINLEQFETEESTPVQNGICEKKNLFSPDNKNCYYCNNEKIGMPGCKGACNFSLNRNNVIKCEDGCDVGYIEVSEGVCESCDSVNHGCYECHYETEYPLDYLGIKRKRRFVCDYCEEGYTLLNGKCLTCSDLGLSKHCEKCEIDPINKINYICTKCEKDYILYKEKYCEKCDNERLFMKNNNCYECNNVVEGGIRGCDYCERNDNNQLVCQKCNSGYILFKNNNTCLKISDNKELEKFNNCEQLSLDNNNQLSCTRCKISFSLLKGKNQEKCAYTPILYDNDYYSYIKYYNSYYYRSYDYSYNGKLYNNYDDDYYYYKNYNLYPCQESINLGTEENPIYSCIKCYQPYEYNKAHIYDYYFTRIINEKNNINVCVIQKNQKNIFENCTEAINKTKDGTEKYDCLKCSIDNKLIYDSNANIHYCQYVLTTKKCMVKYCKSCKNSNNYFCSECLLSDYSVNSLTGSCVKKTEIVPAITWKDIFRLQMNSNKVINGQTITGPSLRLRGITNSQINSRHAFLIYLTFKIKTNRYIRSLDEKKIPAICEVINNVDEISDDLNIVDYECIGNKTDDENLDNYELNNIEEDNNEGLIKKTNLVNIIAQTELKDLINKINPSFTLEDLVKIITFEMDEVKNQTSTDFNFDFTIDGKINKNIEPFTNNAKLYLLEIEDPVDCSFTAEENKRANLKCKINVEKYENQKTFSFKTSEIITDDHDIYISKLDEILLINDNNEKEEEKGNKTGLIIGCIVGGVVVLVIIIVVVACCIKKKSNNKIIEKVSENNVIKYENNQKDEFNTEKEFKK